MKINELKWEAKRFVVQNLIFLDGLWFYVLFKKTTYQSYLIQAD